MRTDTTLDQDRKTEVHRVCVYTSCRGDCNFDARLVSKTRKYQQTNISEIRQDDLRSTHHKKRKHVHISQIVNRSKLVSSANQSIASTRLNAFRSIYPGRRSDHLFVYEHSQILRYVRIHPTHHRAIVGFSSNRARCDQSMFTHVRCILLTSLLLSLLRHGPFIVRSAPLFHRSMVSCNFCTRLDVHNQL